MKMLRPFARLARTRSGNSSVIFALASPLVIGSAALSVETSYWYFKQHQLQGAADNAAYAASLENRSGSTSDVIDSAALNVATKNGFDPSLGTITVGPPTTGTFAGNSAALQVTLTQQQPRFFTQLFSRAPVIIKVNSTAVFQNASSACILALDPSMADAVQVWGSSSLSLGGCVVMANSLNSAAVAIGGSGTLNTACVMSGGGVQNNGGLTETACNTPVTNAAPAPDPFRNLAYPSTSGQCQDGNGKKAIPNPLPPGVYCHPVSLQGDVTVSGGVYVFEQGLSINAQANVHDNGAGTMFYFPAGPNQANPPLSMNGNSTVALSAMTTGPYAGILMFGDRSLTGQTIKINGTSSSVMTGAIYFAGDTIDYQGNFSGANGCTQIVADQVVWTGNATFNVNCTTYGMSPIPAGVAVKLVG
jgi:Flp pilus assembly protein TadG